MIPDAAYEQIWKKTYEYISASNYAKTLKTEELAKLIQEEEAKIGKIYRFFINKKLIDPPIKIAAYKKVLNEKEAFSK